MASAKLPRWSRQNRQQQTILKYTKYKELLRRNAVELTEVIDMRGLWVLLFSLEVLNKDQEKRLKCEFVTNGDQVNEMLAVLSRNPMWKFHAFVRALCLDDQEQVVTQILHLELSVYKARCLSPVEDEMTKHTTDQLQEALRSQKDYYSRTLMKSYLLDIEEHGKMYDMELCYIDIMALSDEIESHSNNVELAELLEIGTGKPKTVILSGPSGAGKSSKVRRLACDWSRGLETRWDLVLILNVSTLQIKETLGVDDQIIDAIWQSLEGVAADGRNVIIHAIRNKKIKVVLIPDGLDECQNAVTSNMLAHMIDTTHKTGGNGTVIATSRPGLNPIEGKLFDKRIKIDGFTVDQAVSYIRQYHKSIQKPKKPDTLEKIMKMKDKLRQILVNPLMVHILCVVTADGTLVLNGRPTIKELLRALEKTMTQRQLEKLRRAQQTSGLTPENKGSDDQAHRVYRMCLYMLLKGLTDVDDQLLQEFGISPDNLYFTFMKARTAYNKDFKKIQLWNFTHEVFLEYLASCGLEALEDDSLYSLLLIFCRQKQCRNTQRILFSALGEDQTHRSKLIDIVRATLLLQFDEKCFAKLHEPTKKHLRNLQKEVDDFIRNEELEILKPCQEKGVRLNTEGSTNAGTLWREMKKCYEDRAEELRQCGLFFCITHNQELLKHIYQCLHEIPEYHQVRVFDNSIRLLLPSQYEDLHTLYPTDKTRWAAVGKEGDGIYIHGWSPKDAEILARRMDPSKLPRKLAEMHLSIPVRRHISSNVQELPVWGVTPTDDISPASPWKSLLQELSIAQAEKLVVDFSRGSPIDGFLHNLLDKSSIAFLVEDSAGWRNVEVNKGRIDCLALSKWSRNYFNQKSVRVTLCNLTCVTTSDDKSQRAVQGLQHKTHGGQKLFASPLFFREQHCTSQSSYSSPYSSQGSQNETLRRTFDHEESLGIIEPVPPRRVECLRSLGVLCCCSSFISGGYQRF